MSDLLKWYIKNIIISGLLYFFIILIGDVLRGNEIDLYYTIFTGIFMGLFFGIVLGKAHEYEIKSLGISDLDGSLLDSTQETFINTNLSKSELVEILKEQSTLKISRINIENDEIVISTALNWKSFGDKITIKRCTDNMEHTYHIVSQPKVRTTIFDYGSNLNNILKIKSALGIEPISSPQLG